VRVAIKENFGSRDKDEKRLWPTAGPMQRLGKEENKDDELEGKRERIYSKKRSGKKSKDVIQGAGSTGTPRIRGGTKKRSRGGARARIQLTFRSKRSRKKTNQGRAVGGGVTVLSHGSC